MPRRARPKIGRQIYFFYEIYKKDYVFYLKAF